MTKTPEKSTKSKKTTKPAAKGKSKSKGKAPEPPRIQLTLDQKIDIVGFILIAIGGLTILSLLSSSQGGITSQWIGFLRGTFGVGFFVIPIVFLLLGLWLLLRSFEKTPRLTREQIAGLILLFVVALMSLAFFDRIAAGSVGTGLLGGLVGAIGESGSVVLLIVGWIIAAVLLFDVTPSEIAAKLAHAFRRVKPASSQANPDQYVPTTTAPPVFKPGQPVDVVINPGRSNGNGVKASATRSDLAAPDRAEPAPASRYAVTPRSRPDAPPPGMMGDQTMANPLANGPAASPASAALVAAIPGDASPTGPLYPHVIGLQQPWELPKIEDVFESGEDAALSEDDLRENARIIEETLQAFGVEGKVIEVNRGPAITQFGVEPGFVQRGGKVTKVKVSKITALADDLALALSAKTIRIEAPVPGRNIVGIEVPNAEIATVALRDVMESESFQRVKHKGALPIALGQDVSGQAVASDLSTMPHLLIAGTTGSGKSVCVNAIISCLMAHFTPDELRMLMVDPKRVELTTYNGVPHLLAPVVVDLEKVTGVLNWVTREMDERYRRFAKSGSRNIDDYNTKIQELNLKATAPGSSATPEPILPYIVVIIDELADLMMLAPDETEKTICRLAQMARATGIHLIIATQRPSVDVVTGLIKANFPARIAFSVASSVDSRVILDTTGAERLLGRGDMLYVAPEVGSPQRLQGCFVSDREIHQLVRYWKGLSGAAAMTPVPGLGGQAATKPPQQTSYMPDIQSEIEQAQANGEDDLLQRAIEVVKLQKKASISLLQRQLRIGYTRAARLIDQMEEKGIVGPATEDSRFREVLVLGDDRQFSMTEAE